MTEASTATDEALKLLLNEESPCEDPHHHIPEYATLHQGPGAFYFAAECPECGESEVILECAQFVSMVHLGHTIDPSTIIECAACDKEINMFAWIKSITEKSTGKDYTPR